MAAQSVRYHDVIQSRFSRLVTAVKPVVVQVAVEAFSKKLITVQSQNDATNEALRSYNRATSLLGEILDQIKQNENHFDTFVDILKAFPTLEGVANELEEAIKNPSTAPSSGRNSRVEASNKPLTTTEIRRKDSMESSEGSGTISTAATTSTINFKCSCGKNCSLDTSVLGECLSKLENLFPYLDLSGEDENDKEKIVRRLVCEANETILKFEELKNSIFKSMEERKTTTEEVRKVALSVGKENRPMPICKELKRVATMSEIQSFLTAHNYITFINYRILKEIVDCLGTPEDKTRMEEYLSVDFSEFCKRHIFEVPKVVFQASLDLLPIAMNSTDIDTQLVLNINESVWLKTKQGSATAECVFSLNEIYAIEETIAKEIDLDCHSILIRSTDMKGGCVQLSFALILIDQVARVFPLSTAQQSRLRHLGITITNQPLSQEISKHSARSVLPTDAISHQEHEDTINAGQGVNFKKKQLLSSTGDSSIWLAEFQGEDGKLVLNKEALDLLKTIPSNKPVAVLSICGPYRSGKSFFLSRMLGTNDAFKVSSEMDPCTKGIWMSTTVLECNNFVVVLLDTEGTNAAQAGENTADMTKLLVLTTLLSSYLIFNTKGAPEKPHINQMSWFSHVSKSILRRQGSLANNEKSLLSFVPQFLWLLRDNELVPKIEGCKVSTTEYVRRKILVQIEPKTDIDHRQNEVISSILSLFPSLECRQTPTPNMKNPIADDHEFIAAINEVANFIEKNIRPKTSLDREIAINGSLLANLAKQYVQKLNGSGPTPNLEVTWVEAVNNHIIEKCKTLVIEYRQKMHQQTLKTTLPIEEGNLSDLQTQQPPDTLAGIHKKIYAEKLSAIESELDYSLPSNRESSSKLLDEHFKMKIYHVGDDGTTIGGELSSFIKTNYKNSQKYCEELFERLYTKQKEQKEIVLQKLETDYYKDAVGPAKKKVFDKAMENIAGPPWGVKIDAMDFRNVKITWEKPTKNPAAAAQYEIVLIEYNVMYNSDGSSVDPEKQQPNIIKNVLPVVLAQQEHYIILTLKPSTKYELQIRGSNTTRKGEYSTLHPFTTEAGKPDKPSTPNISINSAKIATFHVSQLTKEKQNGSEVTDIIVESHSSSESKWELVHTENQLSSFMSPNALHNFHVDLTNCKDSKLIDKKVFFFHIRFKNKVGKSDPSEKISVQTIEMFPGEVRLFDQSSGSQSEARKVELKWQRPEHFPSAAQYFEVRFKVLNGTKYREEGTKFEECTATIEDLEPYTEYLFEVRAVNANHNGAWVQIPITTKPDCPNAPKKPEIKPVSHNKANIIIKRLIEQEENGCTVSSVVIEWRKKLTHKQDKWNTKEFNTDTDTDNFGTDNHNLSLVYDLELDSATTTDPVCYRVSMKNKIGLSPPSEEAELNVDDLIPGPISKVTYTTTQTAILLKWEPPYNPTAVTSYQIQLLSVNVKYENEWKTLNPPSSSSTEFKVSDLKPYTKYKVRMNAVNGRLYKQSEVKYAEIEARTDAAPPMQPHIESMVMHDTEPTKAMIRFHRLTKEKERGSPVDSIQLEWSHDTDEWKQCTRWDIDRSQRTQIIEEEFVLPQKVMVAQQAKPTYYRLKMWSKQVQSEASNFHTVESADRRPGSVIKLNAIEIQTHSVKLEWKPPEINSDAIKHYVINCYDGQTQIKHLVIKKEDKSIEIRSLASAKTYSFEVYAQTEKCIGRPSKLSVATREIIFDPPQKIRAEFRQRTAIKIRWSKPSNSQPESPAYYKVELYCHDSESESCMVIFTRRTRGTSTVIKELEPSSAYRVRVTSMNENGNFRGSTASETIYTIMSKTKRVFSAFGLALPTLGIGTGILLEKTQEANKKDMNETDEEYKTDDENEHT